MHKKITALVVGLTMLTGSVLATTPAEASTTPKYLCYNNSSIPQQFTANTSPKKCNGIYRITVSGKMVAQLDNRQVKNYGDLLHRLESRYKASQKWCSENSLTCTIATAVGSTLLGGVIKRTIEG